jgi:hypothetical protein
MACTPTAPIERAPPVLVKTHVPAYLLSCPSVPQSPSADPAATQKAVAAYVTALHSVATECSKKLRTVSGIITAQ